MLEILAGLALCIAQDDPTAELAQLCNRVAQAENYTFTLKSKSETGGLGGGRSRGGDAAAPNPQPVQGQFQKGKPTHLQMGEMQMFRKGQAAVHLDPNGQWQVYDPRSMWRRGGGRGGPGSGGEPGGGGVRRGEGVDQGGGGATSRGGRESDASARRSSDRISMMAMRSMQSASAPHMLLAQIDSKVSNVAIADEDGKKVFTGKLTPKAAEAMGGARMMRRGGGNRGFSMPEMEHSGTFRIVQDAQGNLASVEVITTVSGTFRDREFERKSTTKFKVSAIGTTEFEVPADALAKLEEAADAAANADEEEF